ncbi:hypothetical protein PF004_g9268 [Phytophthora fragariae]|nr:hypothetical protein PF004_g9268 [Phytophthora fragariae]
MDRRHGEVEDEDSPCVTGGIVVEAECETSRTSCWSVVLRLIRWLAEVSYGLAVPASAARHFELHRAEAPECAAKSKMRR